MQNTEKTVPKPCVPCIKIDRKKIIFLAIKHVISKQSYMYIIVCCWFILVKAHLHRRIIMQKLLNLFKCHICLTPRSTDSIVCGTFCLNPRNSQATIYKSKLQCMVLFFWWIQFLFGKDETLFTLYSSLNSFFTYYTCTASKKIINQKKE